MRAAAILLVLLSACLHAAWNLQLRRERDVASATLVLQALTALWALLVAGLVPGLALGGRPGLLWGVAAGVCEAGYFLTLGAAFRHASLGLAYTVARGGALVLVWPVSVVWLGETVTLAGAAGVLLLLLGLWLPSGEGQRGSRGGLGWSIACAAFVAANGLAYKQSLSAGAAPAAVFALSLAVSVPVALLVAGRDRIRRARATLQLRWLPLGAAAALSTVSFLILLGVLAGGGAGAILTLRNTSVLFALAFSTALGQRPSARQVGGAALVALGAVLVGSAR